MSTRVLIVEDNTDLRDVISRVLENDGYRVMAVDSTENGIDAINDNDFDIALIDINLPGKDGFSMIEYIRSEGKTMPLIAMSARDGLQDKLEGFELGVNDYIVKPFALKELIARMQSHLRIAGTTNQTAEISTQRFRINPETWEFFINNKMIELTKTEFRMMHILMLHKNSVVSTDDLVEFVWGDGPESLNPPVRIHLAHLRKKIHDTDFTIIKTIPGIGYKFKDE
jgi:DNA-binding response OmpR family regulator